MDFSVAYILGSLTAGLTAFYSFRLISLVFLTIPNGSKQTYLNIHEANLPVILPLVILSLFSIFFGFIFSDLFVGVGTDFFANALFIHPNNISLVEAEFSLPLIYKLLPTILSILGSSLALFLYHKTPQFMSENNYFIQKLYTFLNGQYLFDTIYNHYIIGKGLHLGYAISKVLDRGVIETVGPYGLTYVLFNTGNNIAKLDTGIITTYALYITLALLTLLFLVFSPILLDTNLINDAAQHINNTVLGNIGSIGKLLIIYVSSLLFILW